MSENDLLREFGSRLGEARAALRATAGRITQSDLGSQLGVTGTAVGYWENGTTEPGIVTVKKIAEALGVTPGWLAFGQEPRYGGAGEERGSEPVTSRRPTQVIDDELVPKGKKPARRRA